MGRQFVSIKTRHGLICAFWAWFVIVATMALPVTAHAGKYASIVLDADTGRILHEELAHQKRYPASLTKMMTLYLTFDALKTQKLTLNKKLKVSRRAAAQAPSKLGLRSGKFITVEEAILALATKSANDAAVVLAEAIAGTEHAFAERMTSKARQLGMRNTFFQNASGLPNFKQTTTAYDMATLSRAIIQKHSQYYHYFSTLSFKYGGRIHHNHNKLLEKYPGTDGLKTGYIAASGFNLAASAVRHKKRLVCIVFGGPSGAWRDKRVTELFDQSFDHLGRPDSLQASLPAPVPLRKPPADKNHIDMAVDLDNDAQSLMLANVGNTVEPGTEEAEADLTPADRLLTPYTELTPSGDDSGALLHQAVISSSALTAEPREPSPLPNNAEENSPTIALWSIQVGAYSSERAGQKAISHATTVAKKLLAKAKPAISKATVGPHSIYRARLTGLEEKMARDACKTLIAAGAPCMAISPKAGS